MFFSLPSGVWLLVSMAKQEFPNGLFPIWAGQTSAMTLLAAAAGGAAHPPAPPSRLPRSPRTLDPRPHQGPGCQGRADGLLARQRVRPGSPCCELGFFKLSFCRPRSGWESREAAGLLLQPLREPDQRGMGQPVGKGHTALPQEGGRSRVVASCDNSHRCGAGESTGAVSCLQAWWLWAQGLPLWVLGVVGRRN